VSARRSNLKDCVLNYANTCEPHVIRHIGAIPPQLNAAIERRLSGGSKDRALISSLGCVRGEPTPPSGPTVADLSESTEYRRAPLRGMPRFGQDLARGLLHPPCRSTAGRATPVCRCLCSCGLLSRAQSMSSIAICTVLIYRTDVVPWEREDRTGTNVGRGARVDIRRSSG
jgi:hypothetical protein